MVFDVSIHVLGDDTVVVGDAFKKNLTFTFPVISGGIFGTPDQGQTRTQHVANDNNQITLNVSEKINVVSQMATGLQDKFMKMGLEAQPPSTQLARLDSLGYAQQGGFQVMGTAAFEKDTNHLLMLAYFDSKASLHGNVAESGKLFKHQVTVPGAGLYWLRTVKSNENTYVIERADHLQQVNLKVMVKPKD